MSLTRKILFAGILLLVGFLAWNRFFNVHVTNENPSGANIIAFGDSLTSGVGASQGKDYPSQLSEMTGRTIYNMGVPGETTEDALRRLESDVLRNNPRIVIVLLGGNDMMRRLPVENTFRNLETIVTRIQDTGALVVLVGVNSLLFTDSHAGEYKRLARRKGAVFVPNILGGIIGDRKLMADQVHPNDAGYRLMAERIHEKIKPYL